MSVTLDSIHEQLAECFRFGKNRDYLDKYMHKIPDSISVNREEFILDRCKDKWVLHLGCDGYLHKHIQEVAKLVFGIDKNISADADHYAVLDVESLAFKKFIESGLEYSCDIVICGELLEHLSNPGMFLDNLSSIKCPVIITVPNAFNEVGLKYVLDGHENVNLDHVAYYSYYTLKELITRHNYNLEEFYWYKGKPLISEGLIFVVRSKNANIIQE